MPRMGGAGGGANRAPPGHGGARGGGGGGAGPSRPPTQPGFNQASNAGNPGEWMHQPSCHGQSKPYNTQPGKKPAPYDASRFIGGLKAEKQVLKDTKKQNSKKN